MPANRMTRTLRRSRAARPHSKGRPPRALRRGSGEGTSALRVIPQVHEILERPEARAAIDRHGRAIVGAVLRERLETLRRAVRGGTIAKEAVAREIAGLAAWVAGESNRRTTSSLKTVLNATGVILHTNLGRALLSHDAVERMAGVARAYTTLEYDLTRGERGSRLSHLDRVLTLLFPGRAAHIVNNNAAAVLLALNTLAEGREVVVSRGELVEIGGSFRIPDIMARSGALLKEVGTTNRTRLRDYERAIGPRTGLLLKVHPSNYRIVGFTAQVDLREIAALGKRRRLPVMMDQGSGNLADLAPLGIRGEPTVFEALQAGADVVCFSGDKLLGGPQAGFLVGRPDLVRAMRENPLSRALRVDKMTAAALESTLLEHARGNAFEALPVLKTIARQPAAIEARARRLAEDLKAVTGGRIEASVRHGLSLLGGGSAPEEGLPTTLVAMAARGRTARQLEERLRAQDPPVVARIEEGRILLDLRTIPEEQDGALRDAVIAAAGEG